MLKTTSPSATPHPTPRPLVGALPRGASAGLVLAGALGVPASFLVVSVAAAATFPGRYVAATVATGLIVVLYSLIVRHYYLGWLHRRLRGHTPLTDPRDQPVEALGSSRPRATVLAVLAVATAAGWLAAQLAGAVAYTLIGSAGFDNYTAAFNAPPAWQIIVLVLIVAPVSEEVLLRGVAYPLLRSRLGVAASITVTAVAFGLIHANLIQFIATIPLAVIAALVYENTRNMLYPIAVHLLFNLLSVAVPVGLVNALGATGIGGTVLIATLLGLFCARLLMFAHSRHRGTAAPSLGDTPADTRESPSVDTVEATSTDTLVDTKDDTHQARPTDTLVDSPTDSHESNHTGGHAPRQYPDR